MQSFLTLHYNLVLKSFFPRHFSKMETGTEHMIFYGDYGFPLKKEKPVEATFENSLAHFRL